MSFAGRWNSAFPPGRRRRQSRAIEAGLITARLRSQGSSTGSNQRRSQGDCSGYSSGSAHLARHALQRRLAHPRLRRPARPRLGPNRRTRTCIRSRSLSRRRRHEPARRIIRVGDSVTETGTCAGCPACGVRRLAGCGAALAADVGAALCGGVAYTSGSAASSTAAPAAAAAATDRRDGAPRFDLCECSAGE